MNKIYDWTPVPFTYDQILNHTTMPSKLKMDIAKIWEEKCVPKGYTSSGYAPDGGYRPCPWLNMAWLHCDGETYSDMENIGPVGLETATIMMTLIFSILGDLHTIPRLPWLLLPLQEPKRLPPAHCDGAAEEPRAWSVDEY